MQVSGATILVADDEVAVHEFLQAWLERMGCRVFTAGNGAAALEIAASNQVDVLVSDIRMPVMNGLELAKRIKGSGNFLTRILFMTGFSEFSDRETFNVGVEAILWKPLRRQDFVSAVQRCLMPREALWQRPPAADPQALLHATFESLSVALRDGAIAFGRGGFAIRSTLGARVGECVDLRLEFHGDGRALAGQGIVRWLAANEEQIGVEITHVEDQDRAWILDMVERPEIVAFIPRTCDPTRTAR
ncbi:MAG: response regulator [Reyranella sp.]